jgi:hypothetical protein
MPGGTELRAILMYDANDDAKAGFRRIEVLTGPGRRRCWSAEGARGCRDAEAGGDGLGGGTALAALSGLPHFWGSRCGSD